MYKKLRQAWAGLSLEKVMQLSTVVNLDADIKLAANQQLLWGEEITADNYKSHRKMYYIKVFTFVKKLH